MAKVTIAVTDDDIQNGRVNCGQCPVALAFRRAGLAVKVGYHIIWPVDMLDSQIPTPVEVVYFLLAFDGSAADGHWPQPTTFTLDLPDEFIEAATRKDCKS